MFGQRKKESEQAHSWETALLSAAANSMAVIRFHPDGTIIDANENFLSALGYSLQEVQGKHHRIFVDPTEAASPAYHGFWPALAKGVIEAGEFRRITKRGQEIWISASYTPILDAQGKVVQIVKFAQDITARKLASLSLVASLERLSQGDFSVRMKNAQGGSEAELQKSFNYTVEKLDQMVKGIVEGTGSLDMVTSDVENFSRRLSSDTSKQEHELAEIKEAVNQIASQLDATVAAVGRLEADADVSAKRALAGATIVSQAVDAIRSIESLAREVSQNTEVIESFAFQTNLLSLNAAVEAARAGDAGLGFAVVAAEVRALANKSREASQIIADLTRRCEAEVIQGTKLIESAGLALSEIQETAVAVAQATASISAGSRDQSRGIKMVEQSMARIDTSVQGVINLSRDGDQQAVRLKTETSKLRHLVQSFVQDQRARQVQPTAAYGGSLMTTPEARSHRRAS